MSGEKVGLVALDQIHFHQHNVRRDLGDLRGLVDSIRRFGVMQPVVLEDNGERLRIRAGHRRVAAARLAGLKRVPAIIHGEVLDDDEWLTQAVHENTRRKGLALEDRRETVLAMRAAGLTWAGVADAFGVSPPTARSWVASHGVAVSWTKRLPAKRLHEFIAAWEGFEASPAEILAALSRLADECDLTNALPEREAS